MKREHAPNFMVAQWECHDINRGNMEDQDWHETKIRVRYKDTDRMGVVYYGNYLTFFEVARAEFMRDLGLPYSHMESEGYSLAVIEAVARYHANVGYDALITVMTILSAPSKATVRFDYKVLDEGGKLLVDGHTVHACIGKHMKPMRIPSQIQEVIREKMSF
jgi:acyl-CoA thioester hydrolase